MAHENLISDIERIKSEITAARWQDHRLETIIPYELASVIAAEPALKEMYEKRVHFYERLRASSEYRTLYDQMLAAMNNLQREIDRSMLLESDDALYFLPKGEKMRWIHDEPTREKWPECKEHVSAQTFYAALSSRDRWCDLGEGVGTKIALSDSNLCRWRATLEQFAEIKRFSRQHSDALNAKGESYVATIRSVLIRLDHLLKLPWHRDHIADFEEVYIYIKNRTGDGIETAPFEWPDQEEDFKRAQKSAMIVCRELASHLAREQKYLAANHSSVTSAKEPSSRLTYTKRTFRYRGKDHRIKGEPDYAFLCDVFYARCPKSDKKMRWDEVYQYMPSVYRGEPHKGMEKMRGTIKSLNRWAEGNIENTPELLRMEKGNIVRVK